MKYFFANWKARKNLNEANHWVDKFLTFPIRDNTYKVIICPPYPLLYAVKEKIKNTKNISLGAQDVSQFEEGSYTGEVTAKTLGGLVDYVIVGHSERRGLLNESNEIVNKKVGMAKKYNIEPILCVRNKEDLITQEVNFITYEPVHAIGTGENETLEDILNVKKELNLHEKTSFFYGGSVNQSNIKMYLESDEIKGFIVGTASKDPLDFYNMLALT